MKLSDLLKNISEEELAELLRQAEKAHADYVRELGHSDDKWPQWYATYIVKKLMTD